MCTTRCLERVNEGTKWCVSAAVFGTVATLRNSLGSWWLVGAIVAAVLCKLLKRALNQARPKQARLSDPGMPSSHATSLAYLSVFSSQWNAHSDANATLLITVGAPCLALFLAALRVRLGFHSAAQVVAGCSLGSAFALTWWLCVPWLDLHVPHWVLHTLATTFALLFALVNGEKWLTELRATRDAL